MRTPKTERVFRSPAEFRRTMFPEEQAHDADVAVKETSGPGSELACEVLNAIATEGRESGEENDETEE